MRLWDIEARIAALEDALEGIEEGDEALAALEAELDSAEAQMATKLDSIAALIQSLGATAKARKEEADRLARLARADAAKADRLKAFLSDYLRRRGRDRVETPRFRLTFQRAGGVAPVVLTVPPEAIPEEYQRVEVRANLEAIREALEVGESLEFARFGERETILRIR